MANSPSSWDSGSYNYNDPLPGLDPNKPLGTPAVVTWYKLYCVLMIFVYFACSIGGGAIIIFRNQIANPETSAIELLLNGIVLLGMGIVMFVMFIVALLLPPKPWTWIYHLIAICLGLTSCCTWPVTIPLIIQWIKPETQQYFGRTPAGTFPNNPSPPPGPPPPIPPV